MERPLQRADRADDRRVQIGERRGGDAPRERRGVQLVISVQDQRDIECVRRERARPIAGQHVEKVRRVSERGIRLNRSAARLHPAVRRHEARELRRQAHCLAIVRLRGVVGRFRIEVAEHRRQRPERVHAVGRRQLLHEAKDRLAQPTRGGELRLQIAELGAARQPAVPEQITDFLERCPLREIVDVVPVVREHAAIAVEITDRRGCRNHILQPGFGLRFGRHGRIISRRQEAGDRRQETEGRRQETEERDRRGDCWCSG
jgi:hypothetical protein